MEQTSGSTLSQIALDLAANPKNSGPLPQYNGHARVNGPCGSTMEFWLQVHDDKVTKASFVTNGGAASVACGSMATCLVEERSFQHALAVAAPSIMKALDGLPEEFEHCANLASNALRAACENYLLGRERVRATTSSENQPTCDACGDASCSASRRKPGESDEDLKRRQKLQSRLCRIQRKIIVLSGKGGVGKSTVAVNLAFALIDSGKKVGLLDVDIHGPSVPTMLGLEAASIRAQGEELVPVEVDGLKVLSLGFFLGDQDDAVIWRGPMKANVIRQFLSDVAWGDLDVLVIDSPPGTGDEPLSVCQLIENLDGAVIVTTPQKVAAVDVRKSISFCRKLEIPVLGIVENMSGFVCPRCGEVTPILLSGGGRRMAEDMGVRFLGSIPMDPKIAAACDDGRAFILHGSADPTAGVFRELLQPIEAFVAEPRALENAKKGEGFFARIRRR
jgi:ATP-binding protein involved in chromosome partitioning